MPRPSTTSSPALAAPTPTMSTTSTSTSCASSSRALLLGVSRERDDVGALEHRRQIRAIGEHGRPHDVREVRTVGIDDVVVPVRLEDSAVGFEVALVGGEAVGAIENGEKIGQQVDQHSTGKHCGRAARSPSATGAPIAGASDAE